MIPSQSLVFPSIISSFLPPKDLAVSPLIDYCIGGIGISNASAGLSYQIWTGQVIYPNTINSYVAFSAPNTSAINILASPGISWARIAFDQNMHPFVAFIDQSGPAYFWFDPTLPGNVVVRMAAGVNSPNCVMDDVNTLASRLNTNDIILSYIINNNLCYRQLRDRFLIEYVLLTNINTIVVNPVLTKIGMNIHNRLQFEIDGTLYA